MALDLGLRTWHVPLCLAALDPLSALVPPVVLVHQDDVNTDIVMSHGVQPSEVEAEKREHAPGEGEQTQPVALHWEDP